MSEIKLNHICKNPNCNKGFDGKRKLYYACNYCDKTNNWRSIACSFECYQEYMNIVLKERNKSKRINVYPERTDMSEKELFKLLNTPTKVVLEETKEQLKNYIDTKEFDSFSKIVDQINTSVDTKAYDN